MTERTTFQPTDDAGSGLRQLAKLGEAVAVYRSALAKGPKTAELQAGLGAALAMLDRFDEARDACQVALKIDQSAATAWFGLGLIHLRQARMPMPSLSSGALSI
jgi:Flp pilus assembly protein TadD